MGVAVGVVVMVGVGGTGVMVAVGGEGIAVTDGGGRVAVGVIVTGCGVAVGGIGVGVKSTTVGGAVGVMVGAGGKSAIPGDIGVGVVGTGAVGGLVAMRGGAAVVGGGSVGVRGVRGKAVDDAVLDDIAVGVAVRLGTSVMSLDPVDALSGEIVGIRITRAVGATSSDALTRRSPPSLPSGAAGGVRASVTKATASSRVGAAISVPWSFCGARSTLLSGVGRTM